MIQSLLLANVNSCGSPGENCQINSVTLNDQNASDNQSMTGFSRLLWPDLDGQQSAPDVVTWLRTYKFACDGKWPFDSKK